MEYFASIIFSLISIILKILFYDSFMERKKTKVPFLFFIVLFTVLSFISAYIFTFNQLIKISVYIMLEVSIAKILYKATILQGIFLSILFTAFILLIDILILPILSTVFNKELEELLLNPFIFLLGASISYIFQLMLVLIIRKIRNNSKTGETLSYKNFLLLLAFPIASIFIWASIFNDLSARSDFSILFIISTIGLLFANFAIVHLVQRLEKEQKTREENRLLQQQIDLESSNIEALVEFNKARAKITHDHINHLSAVHTLLTKGEVEVAQTYINTLYGKVQELQYVIHTNNPVADAVLNLKYLLAKKHKIHMVVDTNDLENFPLQNADFATILTNTLDNSIEACLPIQGKAEIHIKIWFDPIESLLSVRNTTAHPVKVVDNIALTTKPERDLHGFGLQNVKMVLAKHGYDYAIAYSDGWFQFTTLL